MRVAAVSGDLLVKLALLGAGVAAIAYAGSRGWSALHQVYVPDAINPASDGNAINVAVGNLASAVMPSAPDAAGRMADGSFRPGAWIYDMTHGGQPSAMGPAANLQITADGAQYDALGNRTN